MNATAQTFYVAELFKPLDIISVEMLSKKGVITPFDSYEKDSCVYLYIPSYVIDKDEHKEIYNYIQKVAGKMRILPYAIPFSQIKKNIEKIDEKNKISPGDIVNFSPFKRVPFRVTMIKRDTAIIFHKMIYEDIVAEVSVKKLKRVNDEIETILLVEDDAEQETKINNPILLDCENDSCLKILQALVGIKNMYPKQTVILFNPLNNQIELARVFNIPIMFGNILDVEFKGKIFSKCPLLVERYEIDEGAITRIRDDEVSRIYSFLSKIDRRVSLKLCYGSYVNLGTKMFEAEYNKILNCIPNKKKKYKIYRSNRVDFLKARQLLKDIGAEYISEVAKTVYEIILGESDGHNK